MKGAVDDLDLVIKTLEETGFSHDRFYIHCDGALFGLMMPFVKRVSANVTLNHFLSSYVLLEGSNISFFAFVLVVCIFCISKLILVLLYIPCLSYGGSVILHLH